MQLNQIIAKADGAKERFEQAGKDAVSAFQNASTFDGLSRTYLPKNDDGEPLPPEGKDCIHDAEAILDELAKVMGKHISIAVTKEQANQVAIGHLTICGIEHKLPVASLVWLERELKKLEGVVTRVPVLDPSVPWEGAEAGQYKSRAIETVRTKKVPRSHVLSEATEHHPAQVQAYTEDVVDGHWTNIYFSKRLSAEQKQDILGRINSLIEDVRCARHQANTTIISEFSTIGGDIENHIFA